MFGPSRRIIIPLEHSRHSRYPLFSKLLKDHRAARNVDCDEPKVMLYSDIVDDALDDLPLDLHHDLSSSNF